MSAQHVDDLICDRRLAITLNRLAQLQTDLEEQIIRFEAALFDTAHEADHEGAA